MSFHLSRFFTAGLSVSLLAPVVSTAVSAAESSGGLEEVIVTAQKREESINDVGMSIEAATGDQMTMLGVTDTADLFKIASGFTSNVNRSGNSVYTIRGVGFQENTLATNPTVSVYVDEAPLQFSAMTQGASLDIQRVEVLKGPQGTLFGQNATGGAVSYITNKPTDEFEAGFTASYGRFDSVDVDGFVSGPISDSWGYRLAGRIQTSDDWQDNYFNGDEAGAEDKKDYRAMLSYDADERLRMSLTLSGFSNESDVLRPQLVGKVQQTPTTPVTPQFLAYPLAPDGARDASWSPCANNSENLRDYSGECVDLEEDMSMFSTAFRLDYDLTDDIVFTSLTSLHDFERDDTGYDQDGVGLQIYESVNAGDLESTFQEFRLTGSYDSGNWVVGVNYEKTEAYEEFNGSFGGSTAVPVLGYIDLGPTLSKMEQEAETYAVFGSIEHAVTETLTLQAGIRYTDQERDAEGCSHDTNGTWAELSFLLQGFYGSTSPYFPEIGGCGTLGAPEDNFNPPVEGGYEDSLDEDNTSWRVGVKWDASDDTLLYANVSTGYKNGQFPNLPATAYFQQFPVVQEELLAYEIGMKNTLLDNTLQLNASIFYYDYTDKQIRGAVADPVLGSVPTLVNIPESTVQGGEISAIWVPIDGLRIAPSISYAESEIEGDFRNYDLFYGATNTDSKDFSGQAFPQAPELTWNLAVSYNWQLGGDWGAFVSTNINYQDETLGFFVDECKEAGVSCTKTDAVIITGDSDLPVPDRTLVDAQIGVENNNWRIWLWGKNLTDEYYWNRSIKVVDSIVNYAAQPVTYGVAVNYVF